MQVSKEAEQAFTENVAALDALSPLTQTRHIKFKWPVGVDAEGRQVFHDFFYTQAPLGLFPAQEFQTMLTRTIKETLQGKYGITIGQLFSGGGQIKAQMPSEITQESVDELLEGENLRVISAVLELIELVPGILQECIALSLGVRRANREEFKERISAPPHEGGLTIDDGVDIIKVFVKQNGGPIRRFLAEQTREIGDEILKAIADPKDKKREEQETSTGGTQSSTSSQDIQE